MLVISASEFKAKCLKIMEDVAKTGEEVQITKRNKVIARLVPDFDKNEKLPWITLNGSVNWLTEPTNPVLADNELNFKI